MQQQLWLNYMPFLPKAAASVVTGLALDGNHVSADLGGHAGLASRSLTSFLSSLLSFLFLLHWL